MVPLGSVGVDRCYMSRYLALRESAGTDPVLDFLLALMTVLERILRTLLIWPFTPTTPRHCPG